MQFNENIPIRNLMTKEVITVKPNDPMEKVAEIFKMNNVHHIPVVNDDELVVGIISISDYHKLLNSFTIFGTEFSKQSNKAVLRSTLAKHVMSNFVATIDQDATVITAVGIFRENLFHALPVIDHDGRLKGIITTYDLLMHAYKVPQLLNQG